MTRENGKRGDAGKKNMPRLQLISHFEIFSFNCSFDEMLESHEQWTLPPHEMARTALRWMAPQPLLNLDFRAEAQQGCPASSAETGAKPVDQRLMAEKPTQCSELHPRSQRH